jgi:hypothetical protein
LKRGRVNFWRKFSLPSLHFRYTFKKGKKGEIFIVPRLVPERKGEASLERETNGN